MNGVEVIQVIHTMGHNPMSDPRDDGVWVVSFDHWGQDGISIVAVCATEEAARKVFADEVIRLDYKIERWDVTR